MAALMREFRASHQALLNQVASSRYNHTISPTVHDRRSSGDSSDEDIRSNPFLDGDDPEGAEFDLLHLLEEADAMVQALAVSYTGPT